MNVFYLSYQLTQTHLQATASCNTYENPLAQSPLWDGCCPVRPGPERGCNRQRQTESRCRTPGNSDPHTGTRSRTRTLRWATGGSTIPLNVHTSFKYVFFYQPGLFCNERIVGWLPWWPSCQTTGEPARVRRPAPPTAWMMSRSFWGRWEAPSPWKEKQRERNVFLKCHHVSLRHTSRGH